MPRGKRVRKISKAVTFLLLADFFGVEIADLFKNETSINIKQSFKDSTINTTILILTDREAVGRGVT